MHHPPMCPLWTQGLRCDPDCHLLEAICAPFFKVWMHNQPTVLVYGWVKKTYMTLCTMQMVYNSQGGAQCAKWCRTPANTYKVVHNWQIPLGRSRQTDISTAGPRIKIKLPPWCQMPLVIRAWFLWQAPILVLPNPKLLWDVLSVSCVLWGPFP